NVRGPGIVLPANAGQAVVWVEYDLNGLAFTPKTNLAFLEISCPDAINNPLKVPVAIRMPLPTAIGSDDFTLPKTTRLYPNFPNPFNPGTNIRFDLRRPGEASLRLYDINGRLVRTIVAQKLPAGTYTYAWDAKDNTSRSVASGVYFYVLNVKNLSTKNVVYTEKKKMLLVK
ncbi:MAG: FlgD immunoglobulin-like domain containing protein, partial [bacterium]